MTDIEELNSTSLKEDDNPLEKSRFNSQETLLVLNSPSPEELA